MMTTPIRLFSLASVAVLLATAGVQVVTSVPAAALPGFVRVVDYSATDSSPVKGMLAICPTGTRIIGGGAWIVNGGARVRLTRSFPLYALPTVDPTGWAAQAEEPDTGYADAWFIEVHAMCVRLSSVPGWTIINELYAESSRTYQSRNPGCVGQYAIGVGGEVLDGDGQVGLTQLRILDSLRGARATAREDFDGYALPWTLKAWVICADRIPNAAFYRTSKQAAGAGGTCPPGKFVHAVAGGAEATNDPAAVFLDGIRPQLDTSGQLVKFSVRMTGTPYHGTSAGAICSF
jgi:hypothetical protein